MESKIAILETKVESLEDWAAKHEKDDEQIHKYVTRMMEDFLGKLSALERTGARFEADLTHRSGKDTSTETTLNDIKTQLFRVQLAIATALGALIVIGWFINRIADKVGMLLIK